MFSKTRELIGHADVMHIFIGETLDKRPRTAPLDHQPFLDQLVHGLLDGDAADAVLLTHLTLECKLLSRFIDARLNLRAQFICYFLIFNHNTHSF